jgi:outer membrane protein assembly factor BamD (BamD/ComL family)
MCWSRSQAEAALARLTVLLAGLGLEPKAAKTRIVVRHEAARSEWIRRWEGRRMSVT